MKPIRQQPKSSATSIVGNKKSRKSKRWLLFSYIYLLIFLEGMMILTSFLAAVYKVENPSAAQHFFDPSIYSIFIFIFLVNIFCLLQLLHKQRWGFWGYCLGTISYIGMNLLKNRNMLNKKRK